MSNQKGFTLVELLLAMTLFSAVMVVVTVGFIGMSRSFTRTLARKELSEAAQLLSEDVTRAIRSQGANAIIQNCAAGSPSGECYSNLSAVCVGQVRYVWQPSANPTQLEKDSGPCNQAPAADRVAVLDSVYKIQTLEVSSIAQRPGLFRMKGVITTSDESALRMPDDGDAFKIACRGTAESANVGTCAVEKFDFMINARGASI